MDYAIPACENPWTQHDFNKAVNSITDLTDAECKIRLKQEFGQYILSQDILGNATSWRHHYAHFIGVFNGGRKVIYHTAAHQKEQYIFKPEYVTRNYLNETVLDPDPHPSYGDLVVVTYPPDIPDGHPMSDTDSADEDEDDYTLQPAVNSPPYIRCFIVDSHYFDLSSHTGPAPWKLQLNGIKPRYLDPIKNYLMFPDYIISCSSPYLRSVLHRDHIWFYNDIPFIVFDYYGVNYACIISTPNIDEFIAHVHATYLWGNDTYSTSFNLLCYANYRQDPIAVYISTWFRVHPAFIMQASANLSYVAR